MRLFVAIKLPDNIIGQIQYICECLKGQGIAGRYTKPENIHITLKFMGEVEETRLDQIKAVLSQVAKKSSPFFLNLKDIGFFRRSKDDILWVGVGRDVETLVELYKTIDHGLRDIGFKGDNKPYKPHITIARDVRLDQAGIEALKNIVLGDNSFMVDRISLVSSVLHRQGPVYSYIGTFRFM